MSFLKHFRGKKESPVRLTLDALTISPSGLDADELLSEWRWLVNETFQPVLLTAVGDLFLLAEDGSIHWLVTGTGQFSRVASTLDEFQQLMTQPGKAREWFLPEIVAYFKAQGVHLQQGQCYSYKIPPFLGGETDPSNFELTDVYVHFAYLGAVYRQVKDLPHGTRIGRIVLKKPET